MEAKQYTFMDLFLSEIETNNGNVKIDGIVIPMIQRDYAQGRTGAGIERIRSRFLDSLFSALVGKPLTLDFIYGNIENGVLIPLDGQQRLTTLYLLHWYAAAKGNIPYDEMSFLKRFNYKTRYSARDFCELLVDFKPSFKRKLSDDIINQSWFPLEWKKDPTIASMLIMLDDIDEKFNDVDGIWQKLSDRCITFYILPLEDMELTDELYIKMNSRGKPLTQFEHFKAELEKTLNEIDVPTAQRISRKIDIDWTDMLWQYRDSENITDDKFLHYFKYICDIICYKEGGTPQGRSYDEFDLIKIYFSKDNANVHEHIEFFESCFDCWKNLPNDASPAAFLNRFISYEHESNKIRIDGQYAIDIFSSCLRNFGAMSGRNRWFPLPRIVLLYAIITYLINISSVTEEQFAKRLRIVYNLIANSEDELSDSESRSGGNRIPAIISQIDRIILDEVIDLSISRGFNLNQLNEEIEKQVWLNENPQYRDALCELEDHPLLTGQIGIVGLDNIYLGSSFSDLFACDWNKVDCALMSIGFYGQREQNKSRWRFQLGTRSQKNASAWRALFHKSGSQGFETTGSILIKLLEKCPHPTNDLLDKVIQEYTSECETNHTFTLEYYYIKYPEFRPGSYGKYSNAFFDTAKYMFSVMTTRSNWSENTYVPFLKAADANNTNKEYMGQRLDYKDCYITMENSAYVISNKESDTQVQRILIQQNDDGIDKVNRIDLLKLILSERGLNQY